MNAFKVLGESFTFLTLSYTDSLLNIKVVIDSVLSDFSLL